VVRVDVFGWPALSGVSVRVSPTGMVNLPVLGDVPAGGHTEAEVRADVERRLRDGYMRDPHVTVQVERLLSQRVSVTGAVMRPGLLAARHNR
jgi:polysaccharide export outer membrane protein